ncbi:MAG: 2-C-methyl-D-erythritol 4-phosphate cytidylyltransferase [Gemmataceae bacterium]
MPKVAVILPAAGGSTRFGGADKKPFVGLDGRPVWQRSAELFWNRPDVAAVFVVVSPADRDEFRGRFGHLLAFTTAQIVDGGAERFESVANALARVPSDVNLVAVHDAVRPLTPPSLIDAVFAAAAEHGAALLAVPLADTLKRVGDGGTVSETVPRAGLWSAQTPQVFRRDWLLDAYARRGELAGPITDDAQLVEAAGYPVRVVTGSPANFKITTQDDLKLAEAVLKARVVPRDEPKPSRPFDDEAKW